MSDSASPSLFHRAVAHADRIAIDDSTGQYSYAQLLAASERIAQHLLRGSSDLEESRVAYLVEPGFGYAAVQWGIWRAGGIAVPLATSHPPMELEYTLGDSGGSVVITTHALEARVRPVAESAGIPIHLLEDLLESGIGGNLPALERDRRAMILYTSGTTSRPKGVVSTHATIEAQVRTLVEAWGWSTGDHTLLILPLHHVHGIINVLTCALWSGARCTIHPGFDAEAVWKEIAAGRLTVFMAVPTVYSKLISAWEGADAARREAWSEGCRKMRLMVSGSAALPVSVLERWREISGHTLLERYGMTEIGMALSNPLNGERRPGHVGLPLPGVQVRLVDEEDSEVGPGTPGEIQVRGPSVFSEYWRRPEATRDSFIDGWFRTGDTAEVNDGYFRILGRNSVDILKTGGYKVSALEIEEVLRTHPAVTECAVVGVADEEWGEVVCAAVVPSSKASFNVEGVRGWAAERLAPYKLPRRIEVVDSLPRNAMGKVTKPEVKKLFEG